MKGGIDEEESYSNVLTDYINPYRLCICYQ